jgi:hypothetical protein
MDCEVVNGRTFGLEGVATWRRQDAGGSILRLNQEQYQSKEGKNDE